MTAAMWIVVVAIAWCVTAGLIALLFGRGVRRAEVEAVVADAMAGLDEEYEMLVAGRYR